MPSPNDLNDAIRRLIQAARTADLSEGDLTELTDTVERATTLLDARHVPGDREQASLVHTGYRTVGENYFDTLTPNTFFPYSPVIGQLNPMAPPIDLELHDDGSLRGSMTLGSRYCGPPLSVHGGIIALVFDELLGITCVTNEVGGFTGTLSVRYQQTVPLDTEIELAGWIDRHEGRKAFAVGEMRLGEVVLARAEGIFIRPAQPTTPPPDEPANDI